MYLGRGQTATALDEIKQVLAVKPDMAEAYNLQGLIYAALGNSAAPTRASDARCNWRRPTVARCTTTAGSCVSRGSMREADAQFSEALALPQYRDAVRTLLARGVCQASAGQWREAERTLSHSYELDPTNPVTAYNLSDVLLHRGELVRARFYIARDQRATASSPRAQSLWLAARIEHRAGNLQAVQDIGRQLADRFPKSPEALRFEAGKFDE